LITIISFKTQLVSKL